MTSGRIARPRYWFPKRYADQVARLRVPSGFLLAIAFGALSRPNALSLLEGVPVSIAGLLLRAWAAGHLEKDRLLAQSGPYAWTRNPLYLGTLGVACGLVIAGRSVLLAAIFTLIFVFVYLPVIELEEQHLRDLFPAYDQFAARVPKLIGFRRLGMDIPAKSFRLPLYRKNREYQAALGFLGGLAFLVLKWLWWS